ncbi:pyridoxamine 5'-phosphate oxidase family protein [Thermoactinomyces sp. CICC 10521]|uniref:pyridoxamine 5'-phosphate oxidase family protein n=1 Tax=Thermoactinomyces sp. CICC 10521 TaxID=2767426 RepID=UPI0018DC6341|nr:pyridoxamine 5'-phosphate oxidase family protein [Thermoactinomyces sp. CICC 10521]MBH8608742.1 pyridoxamine 5'-phosphate oxidase family protein [Thermoactinomyces sp. CICC 10521]
MEKSHQNLLQNLINTGIGRKLRRDSKEVKDLDRINQILSESRIGYLGLYDQEGTYVVPLNFTWHNNKIYFHGSNQGRKIDAIKNNNIITCFTVSQEYGTIADPVPAETGTSYFSAMVFGRVSIVKSLEEATSALQSMLDKYVPGYYPNPVPQKHVERYRSSTGSSTVVFRIDPIKITAKEDIASSDKLFYPGRKQKEDLKPNRS